MTDLELILAAENGQLYDDDAIEAAADAIYRTGLWKQVGWAGRFLRDANEASGWLPPKGWDRRPVTQTAGISTPITASSPPARSEAEGLADYTNEVYG
jgi:hypothetical protein